MIRFENVAKIYGDGTAAVKSLDLNIEKGEFFVLIGPSGCGKTTTLKMINRLIHLTDGTIFINEKKISEYDIHELRWNIGYVLQQIALFPHMTIEENIAIVPELKQWHRSDITHRVDELLQMVGLEPQTYRDRKPAELSGGQSQRIGVIRALAADPDIILMDEPFSALDPISREKLQDDIVDLQKRIKKTIVFVTHDIQEALKLGDRICIMKEGEVVQIGSPQDIIQHPAGMFVEEFIGSGTISGRGDSLNPSFQIQDILHSFSSDDSSLHSVKPLSVTSTAEEALERLADEDRIPVEKDGTTIGFITRQSLVKHLLKKMGQGGGNHA